MNPQEFHPGDLPMRKGRIYHLDLAPEELAKDILIVGDPERVPFIADMFLKDREVDRQNRGLRTITGYAKESGRRISVITSGMGTPSMEIVLNEIVALNEIDFKTLKRKESWEKLRIIRVGTSGGIHTDVELGTLVLTEYGVGMDNTGLYYDAPCPDEYCAGLEERVRRAIDGSIDPGSRFKGKILPYATKADPALLKSMARETEKLSVPFKRGITVTNSGFFGNEGRRVSRVPITVPDMDGVLAGLDSGIPGLRFENLEMEGSILLHFMGAQGYAAGIIAPIIDIRRGRTFKTEYNDHIRDAVSVALRSFA